MKKVLISVVATLVVLVFLVQMGWLEIFGIHRVSFFTPKSSDAGEEADSYSYAAEGDVKYRVKAEGEAFYIYEEGKWDKVFWTGVNIGAGEPGIFPGELTISYETYIRWFEQISAMNANCIRVYTVMRPQFYKALADFNAGAENPLYLFHGVWMDEDDIQSLADVYADNQKIYTEFKKDALDLIDVLHGNTTLPERAGYASGAYTADVSKWLAGYMLGIEWDPKFVQNTNDTNPDKNSHDGPYLYTQGASTFEAFLCTVGDEVIAYETEKYQFQAPVSFTNWITTDPISHPDEPHPDEDLISVNVENVKSRNAFVPGLFATYHIYPYYPDSLNYQQDYLQFKDSSGKVNTYQAYLRDLKLAHTMPIMVAEFGVPTSRGMGHESVMGYTQGHIDETRQGEILLDLFQAIYTENYAGGLVFTWQDEWFKRTWNNVHFDIADRRPFWSNIQTTEQCFGLLSFDPGQTVSTCYVDGDIAVDWAGAQPVAETDKGSLYAKCDERYVYLMLRLEDYDFDNDTLLIPIDTLSGQGSDHMSDTGTAFDKEADFVVSINGKDNSRILVDSYYDAFYYLYGEQYKMLPAVEDIRTKNSGRFNQMLMCYGYEFEVPTTKEVVPFKSFETGKLTYGISNPGSEEYQSLADFYYKDGVLEIRIPWQLLNVMDPSQRKIMDDFYDLQIIAPTDFESFSLGFGLLGRDSRISLSGILSYDTWKSPTYHERLKPAYYVLQEGLPRFH